MKKGQILRSRKSEYTITEDFKVAGGQSKISFCKKKGDSQILFIKEFLNPKFPSEGSLGSPATKKFKKEKCEIFEKHHQDINSRISKKVGPGGNLIYALDFFKDGQTYYKVFEHVIHDNHTVASISEFTNEQKLLLFRTILSSLKILHDSEIIHGDLKPDNILVKKLHNGMYSTKLIDFDNAYFFKLPPENILDVVGTPEYYSPELGDYVLNGSKDKAHLLTEKSDIFALGIIFIEYWTGSKPAIDSKFANVWLQVVNDISVVIPNTIPSDYVPIFNSMLAKNPNDRPSTFDLIEKFRNLKSDTKVKTERPKTTIGSEMKKDSTPTPTTTGTLGGSLLKRVSLEGDTKEISDSGGSLRGSLISKTKDTAGRGASKEADLSESRLKGSLLRSPKDSK
jgi:serine/threonine protein kinase